jgi:hypothetical protein
MRTFRRFLDRLTETDEARLSAEIREWADSVPGSVRIASAPMRERVRIAGIIRRMTVFPLKDNESLRFMGRRTIAGLGLGTKIVVEGVIGEQHGVVQMLNPQLELTL